MPKRIYVGNLPWSCSNDDLEGLFSEYGNVVSAEVITDRETGRSRGFGFVQMDADEDGQAAIDGLQGSEMGGRPLDVKEAFERRPRGGGGGGGGRGRDGGGRGRDGGGGRGRDY